MGGRRVQVRRPSSAHAGRTGGAVAVVTRFGAEDPLHDGAVEQMLVGVSTRRYARSLEPLPTDLPSRGTSRSAVSRRFVAATERQMAEWLGRELGHARARCGDDRRHPYREHVMLVALGIDGDGKKHVLGVREGATENTAACTALLADLRDRGLHTDRPVLVVIDGAKALAKAVRNVFGERAIVQRCQAHKKRNVVDQLPDDMKPSVRQALREAYAAERWRSCAHDADEPRASPARQTSRCCIVPRRRPRRDALGEATRPAEEARAAAVDHERDREPDGLGPSPLASREALARWQDDPALDGHCGL